MQSKGIASIEIATFILEYAFSGNEKGGGRSQRRM